MDARDKGKAAGQIIVFIGPGRGKTTAAVGTALRTIATGGKVIFVYFTGPQHPALGEVKTAAAISGNLRMIGIKSEAKDPSYLDDFSESVDTVKEALNMAQTIWPYECDLLILDDITHHLACGSIDITQVIALIDNRPPNTNIVLTGPSAPKSLIERADIVTEFLKIKQPPNSDMYLRQGIDF
jgi:cob(I)alamin adenosyltransferase